LEIQNHILSRGLLLFLVRLLGSLRFCVLQY
jgi:hypothetical protein